MASAIKTKTPRTPTKTGTKSAAARKRARLNEQRKKAESSAAETAKAARPLSGQAIRYLRGLGHHLDPVVQIGKEGITESLVAATRTALLAHELIKVKVLTEAPVERHEAGPELAEKAGATLAQTLGRTLLLYKRHPNKPKIVLPR